MLAKYFENQQFVCLKLVEALYHKGLVDKETFEKIKADYPEVFPDDGWTYWDNEKHELVKVVDD